MGIVGGGEEHLQIFKGCSPNEALKLALLKGIEGEECSHSSQVGQLSLQAEHPVDLLGLELFMLSLKRQNGPWWLCNGGNCSPFTSKRYTCNKDRSKQNFHFLAVLLS